MKNLKQLLVYGIAIVLVVVVLFYLKQLSNSRFTFYHTVPSPYDPYEYFTDIYLGQPDAGAYVTLYDQAGNIGTPTTFYKSEPDIQSHTPQSFDLGPYTSAVFFDEPNYQGNRGHYENASNVLVKIPQFKEVALQKGSVRSVKLEILQPYAIVFSQQNLGGSSMIVRGNVPTMTGEWANKVVSLSISPKTKVTVFALPGFDPLGKKKVFENYTNTDLAVKYVGAEMVSLVNSIKVEALFDVERPK